MANAQKGKAKKGVANEDENDDDDEEDAGMLDEDEFAEIKKAKAKEKE